MFFRTHDILDLEICQKNIQYVHKKVPPVIQSNKDTLMIKLTIIIHCHFERFL